MLRSLGPCVSVESRGADMSIFCLSSMQPCRLPVCMVEETGSTGLISLHRLSVCRYRFPPAHWSTGLAILPVCQTTFTPNLARARLPLWRERAWQLQPDGSSYAGIACERK
jgi:hypothetical protein